MGDTTEATLSIAHGAGGVIPPAVAVGGAKSRSRIALITVSIAALYLIVALAYSVRTPAMETNDEPSHLAYVEYVSTHWSIPRVAFDGGDVIEWQQPPAYYFVVAAWQSVLGIAPFSLSLEARSFKNGVTPALVYDHIYTGAEKGEVTSLHLLRLVSVACGLVVVLCAIGTSWLLTRREDITIATGLTVALWPKLLVVDSSLTNDAMADAVCAVALLATILWLERRQARWVFVLGAASALGALTKYTTLPLCVLLCCGVSIAAIRRRDWVAAAGAPVLFALGTSWLWILNTVRYGDPLAAGATKSYIQAMVPWLIRHHGSTYNPSILSMIPDQLAGSVFYQGGQDQINFPHEWALALDWFAIGCIVIAVLSSTLRRWPLFVSMVGGLLSWFAIASETTLAEGRYLLVGAGAYALVCVGGLYWWNPRTIWFWPGCMIAINGWVVYAYFIPYGRY